MKPTCRVGTLVRLGVLQLTHPRMLLSSIDPRQESTYSLWRSASVLMRAVSRIHQRQPSFQCEVAQDGVSHGTAHLSSSRRFYMTAQGIGDSPGADALKRHATRTLMASRTTSAATTRPSLIANRLVLPCAARSLRYASVNSRRMRVCWRMRRPWPRPVPAPTRMRSAPVPARSAQARPPWQWPDAAAPRRSDTPAPASALTPGGLPRQPRPLPS